MLIGDVRGDVRVGRIGDQFAGLATQGLDQLFRTGEGRGALACYVLGRVGLCYPGFRCQIKLCEPCGIMLLFQ